MALIVILAVASPLLTTVPVLGTGLDEPPPYRAHRFELVDLAFDELPWTDERSPRLPPKPPTDGRGIPLFRWKLDGKLYYRPGALAINGMKRIDAYRDTGDIAQLEQALQQAEVLRRISILEDDAWWLPFWFDYPPEGLKAPWFNAMAQGLALSFYVRLHRVTGDDVHLEAAEKIFGSFLRLGSRDSARGRPWVSFVADGGYVWLEHYPRRTPDHVLNAHLHAVIGLYEYWQHTRSPAARQLLEGSLTTIRDQGERFRKRGRVSRYGLRSRTNILKYHKIHVWQLRLLGRATGDPIFTQLGDQMARDRQASGYVPGRPSARHGPQLAPASSSGRVAPYPPVNPALRRAA
jgi:hypothetical protein